MKSSRSAEHEVKRLLAHGLDIARRRECEQFFAAENPYRFSAYARYFRLIPADVSSPFRKGSRFEDIRRVYEADRHLRALLAEPLAQVEVLLRAQTAHAIAELSGQTGTYLQRRFYDDSPDKAGVVEAFMRDIARNMDRRLMEYWHDMEALNQELSDMPVWVGVEALTFGTLSKVIQRGARGELSDQVANRLGIAKAGFASRVKAMVYLRNRCAHHSQLWNHWVIDAGATPNNARSKARRSVGDFDPRSIMDVIASMDDMLLRAHHAKPVAPDLSRIFGDDPLVWSGYCQPRPLHPNTDPLLSNGIFPATLQINPS